MGPVTWDVGAILGGFMTGIVSSLMPAGTKLRVALWFLMPVVVATGMVVYGWAVVGIFSGSAFVPWCMLYMLCLSCVTVTTGLMLVFGPVAMPVCIFLMPLLGLGASGLTTPLDWSAVSTAGCTRPRAWRPSGTPSTSRTCPSRPRCGS